MSLKLTAMDGWPWAVVVVAVFVLLVVGHWLVVKFARAALTIPARSPLPLLLRYLSRFVGPWHLTGDAFFAADGAGGPWVHRRRAALEHLASRLERTFGESAAWGSALRDSLSDLRFTDLSRVPFQFAREMRARFNVFSAVTESRGPWLKDAGGTWTLDVSGSYGLNVAGFGRYRQWIANAVDQVTALGPVLGPLHPVVADNVARLRKISGLDEVSFHMSGTEAVMAAVRMARFNTRRRFVVCFAGAYHGWWDGVQPGLGSEREIGDCLTLKELSPHSLRVIRQRASEIAAVLVNPIQALHPNAPPPNDAVLVTSEVRRAADEVAGYRLWLNLLRDVCTACDVPLIFDEVYTGFRLAPGGAQEYFGVRADMVVYGKTVGGGMPIGVVVGHARLMRRVDPDRPMRMAYIVGTFSAHPVVMAAMNEFLRWVTTPEAEMAYADTTRRTADWAHATNQRLADGGLPIRIGHLTTVWTVLFTDPGRYNWLLQYYMRAEGITLSWVGTGRCLISMDFSDEDYDALQARLVAAAGAMKRDGWWLTTTEVPDKERLMRKQLIREVAGSLIPAPVRAFHAQVMRRKEDDHHASHNDPWNQYLHLISSSIFIYCYAIISSDLTQAMFLGVGALLARQFGHAVLEPACHDEEKLLLGYNTRNKTAILAAYILIPLAVLARTNAWSIGGVIASADLIALQWFRFTLAVVLGRVAYLVWKHDVRTALVWVVKLVTDPFTDIVAYFPRRTQRA